MEYADVLMKLIKGEIKNLRVADLWDADLRGANLQSADLQGADLRSANLQDANLQGAYLQSTNLLKTCLDYNNKPNGKTESFRKYKKMVIGYRTRRAGHIDIYRNGRYYSADVFSTADTECHPGLYLWPTIEAAKKFSLGSELIKVRTEPKTIHKAGNKYRCQWFYVIGGVK